MIEKGVDEKTMLTNLACSQSFWIAKFKINRHQGFNLINFKPMVLNRNQPNLLFNFYKKIGKKAIPIPSKLVLSKKKLAYWNG